MITRLWAGVVYIGHAMFRIWSELEAMPRCHSHVKMFKDICTGSSILLRSLLFFYSDIFLYLHWNVPANLAPDLGTKDYIGISIIACKMETKRIICHQDEDEKHHIVKVLSADDARKPSKWWRKHHISSKWRQKAWYFAEMKTKVSYFYELEMKSTM